MATKIHVGTSGWNYKHWKGRFYPEHLSTKQWFSHYAETFDTVEINNTFYNQPENKTFDSWNRQAPGKFLYAVKANRYLTHMRKLNEPKEPLDKFLDGAQRLKSHLGPILYQLPPNWKRNLDRLREFARLLPKKLTHAIEFRNRDWFADETYALMEQYQLCLCVHDMLPRHPRRATGPALYVRLHGVGKKYGGKYPPSRLQRWADWINEAADGREAYVYFNNDDRGYAVENAKELQEMVG